jgi:hypothetical protein
MIDATIVIALVAAVPGLAAIWLSIRAGRRAARAERNQIWTMLVHELRWRSRPVARKDLVNLFEHLGRKAVSEVIDQMIDKGALLESRTEHSDAEHTYSLRVVELPS